jgi:hypothetical protein
MNITGKDGLNIAEALATIVALTPVAAPLSD